MSSTKLSSFFLINRIAYSVQPQCVRFPSSTADGPFTAISTNRVFPFWFNLVLEAMEVSSNDQLARVMNIIVKAEKTTDPLVGIYLETKGKVGWGHKRTNQRSTDV